MPRAAAPVDVREAILDAAMRLMERYGYKKMTMEDIAGEARIGKATIYGYFNNKEDVGLSVVNRYKRSLQERWREIATTETPPAVRLRKMLVTQVLFGFDTAQRYRQSLDDTLASLRHLILPQREFYNAELARFLAEVLQEGCTGGEFVCDDTAEAAQTLLTAVSGLSPTNLSPRELGAREEIEARTNSLVDLLLQGLLSRAEACSSQDALAGK